MVRTVSPSSGLEFASRHKGTSAAENVASRNRSRALAVVAKLSIFAGIAGCGGTVVVETDSSEDVPADEAPAAPGDAYPTNPGDMPVDSPPVDSPPVDSQPLECEGATATATCCSEVLTIAFADATLFDNPALATSQQTGCCELLVTMMDEWTGAEPLPFDSILGYSCCNTQLVEGSGVDHPSCTPWGPPMPPRMEIV